MTTQLIKKRNCEQRLLLELIKSHIQRLEELTELQVVLPEQSTDIKFRSKKVA